MSRVIAAFAQFFDSSGDPLENGWIEFLASNTTSTQKPTYSDSAQQIPNANPLQLGADGRCPDAFGTGAYRVRLYEKNPVTGLPGTLVQEFDPVTADCAYIGAGENFEEWDGTTTYQVGNIVVYAGNYYTSIAANNIANVPSASSAWWEQVNFIRQWNVNAVYEIDDVVVDSGAMYFSLQNANVGHVPLTSPTWWNPVGSGTILLNWEESGTAFQPKVSGYDIGSATNLVGDVYIADSKKILLGTGQDFEVYHDGVNAFLSNTVGNLYIDEWAVDTNGHLVPNTTLSFNIGSVTNYVDTIYVGTIISSGVTLLTNWEENGTTFRPVIAGYDIGDATNYIGDVYLGDSKKILLGNSQDFKIYFGGSDGALYNPSGYILFTTIAPYTDDAYSVGLPSRQVRNVYVGNAGGVYIGSAQQLSLRDWGGYARISATHYMYISSSSIIRMFTGGSEAWTFDTTGTLYPGASDGYDIGSITRVVRSIYIGDAGQLYFGLDQDQYIYHDGIHGVFFCETGSLNIGTTDLYSIQFHTNSIAVWEIDNTGELFPVITNSLDIGDASHVVDNIYVNNIVGATLGGNAIWDAGDFTATDIANWNTAYGWGDHAGLYLELDGTSSMAGHILFGAADTYNIGSTTYEVRNIYLGEAGRLYFGLDQDMSIYHNGTNGFITNGTGILTINFGGPIQLVGSGSPESVVTAVVGSIYTDTSGGASTTLYIKESGTGNTGWVAK